MYGLLLDSIQKLLREKYGERYWASIRRRAKLKNHWFVTHEVYPDSVMHDLVDAAAMELGEDQDTVMMMFGEYFAENIGRYGYARLLRVLGRDLRDFLNGLDDLHEYLRFSYPKMRPPSFLCENESPEGMFLHYTTCRRGYLSYVIGQLGCMGKIYGKDLQISIVKEEEKGPETHVVLDLKFDNREILMQWRPIMGGVDFEVDSDTFLSVFPFCVLYDQDLVITRVGSKLNEVLPNLVGRRVDHAFTLRKPRFGALDWETILMHVNCTFELASEDKVVRYLQPGLDRASPGMEFATPPPSLKLKGQMLPLKKMNSLVFLCSPAMDSPEDLYESGIFINDLSMHDSSRDFILAGSQQNPELNLALSQEKIRSAQLEESIQRTDHLLYQMIPKPIADQLRSGETPLNTCQEFNSVSILFSDVVSFTPMCSRLRPMEVVCVLNAMYVAYDKLCEKHHVYKVETIGDAYMVISGAPIETEHHAEYITNFAFSIIKATSKINDPSTNQSLRIRIGIHSGTVVAGVVGASILRYDVFGDTVNVAARMEASGEPMKVHISEATAELLRDTQFKLIKRGQVEVKGKGLMQTYWVLDKDVHENNDETMLNPFQRLRHSSKPALLPSSPSPTTPPPTSQSLFAQPRNLRRISPKPDEWPEADRRLGVHAPPDFRQRSGTVPVLEVPPSIISRARTRHGSLSNTPPSALVSPYVTSGTSTPLTYPGRGGVVQSRSNSITSEFAGLIRPRESEFNILRVRESTTLQLPTIPETSPSHLALFAAIADENARQARRLADWAAELARAAAKTKRESSVDLLCPSGGTSVDLEATPNHTSTPLTQSPPPPSSVDVSTQNHTKSVCRVS